MATLPAAKVSVATIMAIIDSSGCQKMAIEKIGTVAETVLVSFLPDGLETGEKQPEIQYLRPN